MKDLGFNEYGEVQNNHDEESKLNVKKNGGSVEMSKINKVMDEDPDGDEEAEDTEIAI